MLNARSRFVRTPLETEKLMEVSAGKRPADLAVINARLLNVYTGELIDGISICVWDRWIAYVGDSPDGAVAHQTEIVDAQGKTVVPGLIDGHTHMAWLATAEFFLEHMLASGTTTLVTEAMEPYPVSGLAGVVDFIDSLQDQPIKVFATAPAMASTSRASMGISREDLASLLERDDVVGLGESYWQAVLQFPERFLPSMTETLRIRKSLEGHTAGAGEKKLMAYVAAGVSSCHEPIKAEEVLQRLRLGLHVMVREGSIRRDLEAIAAIAGTGADLRRLVLVSDGVEPGELMERGYMEHIVQKAIDSGFDPVTAIQMATLNAAEHFRLDHLVGGVAPGRFADMVIIPDLKTIRPDLVISNGKVIAREGKPTAAPRRHRFSRESLHSVRLQRKFKAEDFSIPIPAAAALKKVRVIEMATDLVTRESLLPLSEGTDNELRPDPERDIAKVAAVDRTLNPGKTFVGLIKGFGLKSGAIACSAAWDTTDIIVVGAEEGDMACAVNRIGELQGGAVLCSGGKILQELPLPVFGIMCEQPLPEIDRKVKALRAEAFRLGIPFRDPLLSLITLTGAAIPFLRICEEGLVSLKDGKTLDLFE